MPASADLASLFLFVPADRPERFAKAASAGIDAVIIDLEDAVSARAKEPARAALSEALANLSTEVPVFLRVNGIGTPWHAGDIELAAALGIAGVVLPKAESTGDIAAVRKSLPSGMAVVALVETARGLESANEIARASNRLAFGSVDLAADLGCAHEREPLLFARSRIVMAARLAGRPQPIDGVTLSIRDEAAIEDDARHAAALGFGGKLLIHPAQAGPARRGLSPGADDIAWAERAIGNAGDGAARAVDGMMIDAPVLARARHILRFRDRLSNG